MQAFRFQYSAPSLGRAGACRPMAEKLVRTKPRRLVWPPFPRSEDSSIIDAARNDEQRTSGKTLGSGKGFPPHAPSRCSVAPTACRSPGRP